jgi:hypothetical protein
MTSAPRHEKVDEMMERAEAALRRAQWFEAERIAIKALELARREEDFAAMSRIVLPLQEARRQRIQAALTAAKKKVRILDADITEEMPLAPGVYLIQPPTVGADARRLRLAALRREIPVAVMCREPRTQRGQCPVVAIGGMTVRARIDAPKEWDKPDFAWFVRAMEDLGDAAMEMLDTGIELDRQIDFLLNLLDSVPDHEKLHQLLAAKCAEAARGFVRSSRPAGDVLDEELAGVDESELEAELGGSRRKKEEDEE